MKLEIMAIGKLRDKRYRKLMREYLGRLDHYTKIEETVLRESKRTGQDREEGLREEAQEFAKRCDHYTVTVALDERGDALTSMDVARQVEEWMTYGTRHIAFCIGSASGLDATWREECDMVWRLSAMTLPHEMARVMLAEQLYRAMTIIRGEPYHK